MSERIEFSAKTKNIIARRSGYRCAYLGCDRTTIGPAQSPNDASNSGEAAHIWSAAENGPRGRGDLDEEQLKSAQNGIWFCRVHAKIVDEKRGSSYPAGLLLSYRELHEAQIAREQQGLSKRMAWIDKITVAESPLFMAGSRMSLAKVTLVVGNNGSGRTALCEWISSLENHETLDRWRSARRFAPLRVHLRLFDPAEQRLTLGLDSSRRIYFEVNDARTPFNPFPFRAIWLRDEWSMRMPDHDDEWIASLLGIEPHIVEEVIREISQDDRTFIRNLRIETDDDGHRRARATMDMTFRSVDWPRANERDY